MRPCSSAWTVNSERRGALAVVDAVRGPVGRVDARRRRVGAVVGGRRRLRNVLGALVRRALELAAGGLGRALERRGLGRRRRVAVAVGSAGAAAIGLGGVVASASIGAGSLPSATENTSAPRPKIDRTVSRPARVKRLTTRRGNVAGAPNRLTGNGQERVHGAQGRRTGGPALEPREGLLSEAGLDEARPRHVLPDLCRRGAAARARAPDDDEALRQRDHGGPDLAEARAAEGARLAADGDGQLSLRPDGGGARRQRRRAPGVGGQPRRDRLQPVAVPAGRPRPSGRAARGPLPGPGVEWDDVRQVALVARDVLDQHGLRGHPKTSGSKGIHVLVRITPDWEFLEVRARRWRWRGTSPARARAGDRQVVEGRAPRRVRGLQPERARPHRGLRVQRAADAGARGSCALEWSEVADVEPGDLRLDTVPARLATVGDPAASIDDVPGSLDALLDLARRDEEGGLGDAPWPPHFPKAASEPKRVQPSRDADRPVQRGRAGDPQPGGPPPGFRCRTSAGSGPSPAPAKATSPNSTRSPPRCELSPARCAGCC